MKKLIFSILALGFLTVNAHAVPAWRGVFKHRQPDGSVIELQRHGDEFFHWTTDAKGQVMRLDERGFYRPSALSGPQKELAAVRRSLVRRRQGMTRVGEGKTLTSGQRHIPVVLVSFQDKDFTVSDPKSMFDKLLNQHGYAYNGATGSVRDYYYENSHGVFEPVFDVYGPVMLPHEIAYYGGDENRVPEAVNEAASLLDYAIDFSQYDTDKNGTVDMILMYYAGYNEAEGGPEETIWPHQYYVWDSDTFDGKRLDRYFCTSELKWNSGSEFCSIGTTSHEFAHSLGLPDFYDTDYEDNGSAGALYDFSIMCSGSYLNSSNTPPHFNAIERNLLGWMLDEDIRELKEGVNEIPSIRNDVAYKLPTDVEGEFFLIETRDGTAWDAYLPEGMVIYHVDRAPSHDIPLVYTDERGTARSYSVSAAELWDHWEYYNAINQNGSHPCFYVVPSGDPGNLWYHYDYPQGNEVYEVAQSLDKMVYPGAFDVTEYTPVTWDRHELGLFLQDIDYRSGISHVTLFKDSGLINYSSIACASSYKVGDILELKLVEAEEDKPASVSWTLDGRSVSGSVRFSSAGICLLEATLSYADGRREVIESRIEVTSD